jgi:hypothetical protein
MLMLDRNIYYGTIYAYTPEILPSAHRATGYGICVVLNRVGGILGVLVGSYANVKTTAPLFVCASLSLEGRGVNRKGTVSSNINQTRISFLLD